MIAILTFISIIIGFNCIPLLIKRHNEKLETAINQVLITATITFVILTILLFFDYRLKGIYTNSIIASIFIISCLLYFILIRITWGKIIKSFVLIPLILLSLYSLSFGQTVYENKINDTYHIETYAGGFLACGESIRITKSAFVIFDKAIYQNNLCIRGISKIETIEFNDKSADFLIFHDAELDSENPYKFHIENENLW